jgi:hypothetical protein
MFKRNQIQKSLVVAGVTLASFAAFSQQNETTTASVTVQNAFTLTEVTGLSFGTITASQVSGASSIEINADGTAGDTDGTGIRILAPGSAATYTIAGAAPFTDLKVSTNVDSVDLTNANAPGDNPDFTLSDFTLTDGTVTGALNSTAFTEDGSGGGSISTDVGGGASLSLGGTLTLATRPGSDDILLTDGAYEGQFTITVSY